MERWLYTGRSDKQVEAEPAAVLRTSRALPAFEESVATSVCPRSSRRWLSCLPCIQHLWLGRLLSCPGSENRGHAGNGAPDCWRHPVAEATSPRMFRGDLLLTVRAGDVQVARAAVGRSQGTSNENQGLFSPFYFNGRTSQSL